MRRFRSTVLGAALLALLLVAAACGSGEDDDGTTGGSQEKGELTVGSDAFAEAQIMGEMYAQVLENAGYTINRQLDIEAREVRLPAMESGEVDIAPEYVHTLLTVVDPENEAANDPEVAGDAQAVREILNPLLAEDGLTLLEPSEVVDSNALVVTQEFSDDRGVEAVSDLAPIAGDLTLGGPTECPKRPLCIPGFERVYGIEFGDFKALEYGASITALGGGEIDVALLFSTDGSISEQGFVLLEDDKDLQAADNITPLVREGALNDEIGSLLNEVSASIETDKITELNKRANVDVEDPADLAEEYLDELGLLN
jgi:osmoprotectant transport system substrate-binding protein